MSQKSDKIVLWTSVLGTLALTVTGMVLLAKYGNTKPMIIAPGVNEITADDHVRGASDAKVTLVEYGDFVCPACGIYAPIVEQAVNDYGDRVRFVFRDFPLDYHTLAVSASLAAEAAGQQGKYWEMFDLLYAEQKIWSIQNKTDAQMTFVKYSQQLGLDIDKFVTALADKTLGQKIDKDYQSGVQAGVDATPSFYLNGKKIYPQSYDDFKREFDNALAGS